MFDTDGNRSLDRDEFRAMLKATLTPSMALLLRTTQGVESFREFLQFEYAVENLEFMEHVDAFEARASVDMAEGRYVGWSGGGGGEGGRGLSESTTD